MSYTQEQLEAMSDEQLNHLASSIVISCDGLTYRKDYCNNWQDCGTLIDGNNILVDGRGHAYSMNVDGKGFVVTGTTPCRAATIVYILIKQG